MAKVSFENTSEEQIEFINSADEITKEGLNAQYEFEENGKYTIYYKDIAENQENITLEVDWIDKANPKIEGLEDGKTLYLIEDVEIGNNMYVVTPNVSEAIKRAERNTIGIINDNGNIEVPMVNCDVISINDTYVAVGTKKEKESNPEDIQKIKEKIERNLSSGIDFIIIDDKIEYDVYKVEEGKLNLVFDNNRLLVQILLYLNFLL